MISTGSRTLIAHAIIDNAFKALSYMAQNSPHPHAGTMDSKGAWFYYTGSDFPLYNGVYCDRRIERFSRQFFAEILDFYQDKKVPFMWWWRAQTPIPESIQQELIEGQFEALAPYTGLATRLDQLSTPILPARTRIKEVTSQEEYEIAVDIVSQLFYFGETTKQDYYAMFKSFGTQGLFRHYIAYYAGEPAAVLSLLPDDDIAGIYHFGTLEKFRGNGVSLALVHHAMYEAWQIGGKLAVTQLMGGKQGAQIMERLGFVRYCQLLPFVRNI